MSIAATLITLSLIVMLAGGIWISLSLAVTAWIIIAYYTSAPVELVLGSAIWSNAASWPLAALPLFIWMGEILHRTHLSRSLFEGLTPWLQRLPGGLLHVNIFACTVFGAVCGSSAATCATVSKIAIPTLMQKNYPTSIIFGSLAGAGTIGLMMPPSIMMIVYGVAAQTSVIKLFAAGFVPALMISLLFSAWIVFVAMMRSSSFPPRLEKASFKEKIASLGKLAPCIGLISFVMGSIILGVATPTEAAAFGVVGSIIVSAAYGGLSRSVVLDSMLSTVRFTGAIVFILCAASFLSVAVSYIGLPQALAEFVAGLEMGRYSIILAMALLYLLFGCFLDGISMLLLTISVALPLVQSLGFDLVWFGIFIILVVEIAQITPPIGFNLFVMQTMTGRDAMRIAMDTVPFFLLLILSIAIITVFPEIVTFVPDFLFDR